MFTVTRDHKIADLKNKLSYWHSAEGQTRFINGVKTNEALIANRFGIDRVSGGYYYLSDNLVGFYDLSTGNSIRIKKLLNGDKDWNFFVQLYEKGLVSDFRTEVPGHREVIEVDAQQWEYAELSSPNGEYGQNYEYNVFDWPPLTNGITPNVSITTEDRTDLKNYLKQNIDEFAKIIPHAAEIAVELESMLPLTMFNNSCIYRDSAGPFWSEIDLDNPSVEPEAAHVFYEHIFRSSLIIAEKCNMLTQSDVTDLMSYVQNKWSQ